MKVRIPKELVDRIKQLNSERGVESRPRDLTSYFAHIGDSFKSRVDLLEQLIRDAHYLSLGRYKESILHAVIKDFLPSRYSVGSGFVLFPTNKNLACPDPQNLDHLNLKDHEVSREIDVLIYDSQEYPTVFRDGAFVVVRPEAVRAIVEVKGTLNYAAVKDTLDKFVDFGRKWKDGARHYHDRMPTLSTPRLLLMAWSVAKNGKGLPLINGKSLRKQIVRFYSRNVKQSDIEGFPILNSAYIYNDCEVSGTLTVLDDNSLAFGYMTSRGRFVQYLPNGTPVDGGEMTVASLLAGIQVSLCTPFNHCFSYVDQSFSTTVLKHPHTGFDVLLRGDIAKKVT